MTGHLSCFFTAAARRRAPFQDSSEPLWSAQEMRPLALEDGLIQPLLEADLAESRVVGRNQRALAEFGPEVSRMRVNDNLTGVSVS